MAKDRDRHDRERDRDTGSHSSKRSHDHHDKSTASSVKRHRSSKSHGDDDRSSKSSKHHGKSSSSRKSKHDQTQDDDDDDEWVEKQDDSISIAASLLSTANTAASGPPTDKYGTFSVGEMRASTLGASLSAQENMTDGYGEGENGTTPGGAMLGDLFSNMGTERKRREPKEKVDPSQMMGQSSRELNKAHWQGTSAGAAPLATPTTTGSPAPGSTGSNWRMIKLKRTLETAQEEGRPVEEVALERYGSLDDYRDAVEERRILDERDDRRRGRRSDAGGAMSNASRSRTETPTNEGRRFMFTDTGAGGIPGSADSSRPASRGSFRRPGEAPSAVAPPSGPTRTVSTESAAGLSRPQTPVPSVFTPPPARNPRMNSGLSRQIVLDPDPTTTSANASAQPPPLTQSELNKLQAKVLKARLLGADNADQLEKEYEAERTRALEAPPAPAAVLDSSIAGGGGDGEANAGTVRVLPTLDGHGRLYDIGSGKDAAEEGPADIPGRRKKKEKAFETHDPKTGELIRHNPDDDTTTLAELVRQERFSAGAADQKNMDAEIADRIARDGRYDNSLDYVDEHAERLARKKMKSDVMKKAFAVQDYARTKKALDNCNVCFGDEGQPPRAATVALGTRAYLGLLENEELVPGHCRIVPIQHHFSSLDADDETWDEIKNFMKTLMQMNAEEDKGVIFFESCINLKWQKHTSIEAIPVPFELFDELPGYFREAIDTSEQEWSQHKKRIEFTAARPFRRALVPNLPYFMVHFDYKGEKGYGHVIEGVDDGPEHDADGEERRGELGDKGGGEFPRWFAQEIIGNMLDLAPRQWRKPRRIDPRQNPTRVQAFRRKYDQFDWTKMLTTNKLA